MKYAAFISREFPTTTQLKLAYEQDIKLVHVGYADAYDKEDLDDALIRFEDVLFADYMEDGNNPDNWEPPIPELIIGVHPMIALYAAINNYPFGWFENEKLHISDKRI